MEFELKTSYKLSEKVVAREIDDEIIIVPLESGIGNIDDELYSLSKTGKTILKLLDGKRNLKEVVKKLSIEFEELSPKEIEEDVIGFTEELLNRGIIVENIRR